MYFEYILNFKGVQVVGFSVGIFDIFFDGFELICFFIKDIKFSLEIFIVNIDGIFFFVVGTILN